jgi:hypothetical protein
MARAGDKDEMTAEAALTDPRWRLVVEDGTLAARSGHSRRKAPKAPRFSTGLSAREVWLAAFNAEIARRAAEQPSGRSS